MTRHYGVRFEPQSQQTSALRHAPRRGKTRPQPGDSVYYVCTYERTQQNQRLLVVITTADAALRNTLILLRIWHAPPPNEEIYVTLYTT